MNKLLVLGAVGAIALAWLAHWLIAAIFVCSYAGLLELYRAIKKNESDIAYIEMRRRSLAGLRRVHRRGL